VIHQVPGADQIAAGHCHAHDYTDPGKPRIAWNDEAARAQLVDALVTDAVNLLGQLPDQPLGEAAANAVALLALVAGQDVEPAQGSDGTDGRWRIARRTVPDRVISTVDPEARHIHKNRTRHEEGFKGHLAVEPESGIYTEVALRPGCGAENHEAAVAEDLLASKAELTVLGDAAYGTGEGRQALTRQGHTLVIKPPPLRQAIPGGFSLADVVIDTAAGTVTCPAGNTIASGGRAGDGTRTAQFKAVCRTCPLRQRCTTSKTGRNVRVHPHHDILAAARHQVRTDPVWQVEYRRWRPGVERGVAWLVAGGNRRLRYRGVVNNDVWLHTRAAVLDLRCLINLGLTRTAETWTLAAVPA
jgi:hypothetical protein